MLGVWSARLRRRGLSLAFPFAVGTRPQPEPEIGDGAGDEREPVVHDPVAEHGQHLTGASGGAGAPAQGTGPAPLAEPGQVSDGRGLLESGRPGLAFMVSPSLNS